MQDALNAWRSAQPLHDHTLSEFVCVRRSLSEPDALSGPAAVETAIMNLLASTIRTAYARARRDSGLPAPPAEPDRAAAASLIAEDFAGANDELKAWSVLFFRYVRVTLALETPDIAEIAHVSRRTVTRVQSRGIHRLTGLLVEQEQAARREDKRLRMRLRLPPGEPDLIGVGETRRAIVEAARAGSWVYIGGPGGRGKSALAWAAALDLLPEMDNIAWIANPTESAPALLERIARALGIERIMDVDAAEVVDDPALSLRAYLQKQRTLIVLDGAEAMLESGPEALNALAAAHVLITGRIAPPVWLEARAITTPELDRESAHALIAAAVPDLPPETCDRLWEMAGGNPQALALGARLARGFPHDRHFRMLGEAHLPEGGTLFAVLYAAAHGQLSALAERLWGAVLLFPPEGAPAGELTGLFEAGEEAAGHALNELIALGLLESSRQAGQILCRTPKLARAYLRDTVDAPAKLARRRIARFRIRPDLESGLYLWEEASALGIPLEDVYGLHPLLHQEAARAGRWVRWSEALAAHIPVARGVLADVEIAEMRRWQGIAARWLGQWAESVDRLRESMALAGSDGAFGVQAAALCDLAVTLRYLRQHDAAMEAARQAYHTFSRRKDRAGIGQATAALMQLHLDGGNPGAALMLYERLAEEQIPVTPRLEVLRANAHLASGEPRCALEIFEDVLRHHGGLLSADAPNRARLYANMARARMALGDAGGAQRDMETALNLMQLHTDPLGTARTRNNLAALALARRNPEEALPLLEEVAAQQEQIGDWQGLELSRTLLAEALARLAERAQAGGDEESARAYLARLQKYFVMDK